VESIPVQSPANGSAPPFVIHVVTFGSVESLGPVCLGARDVVATTVFGLLFSDLVVHFVDTILSSSSSLLLLFPPNLFSWGRGLLA
jgi:hypothetical protein